MRAGAEARLLENPTLGPVALDRLQGSWAGVIGAGTLGAQLIPHFGLLQVGLSIVDAGRVESENLGTQAFNSESVGRWKAEARAHQVAALNPDCAVRALNQPIERLGLAALADCDVLLTGLDSRVSRLRVSEIARELGIVWIDAALDGSGAQLFGTVSVYDPRHPDAACAACPYDPEELARIASEGRGPGCPSWRDPDVPLTAPTLQTSAFAAVVAGHQAIWALQVLLGRGGELGNQRLLIEAGGSSRVRCVRLERNPSCPSHQLPLTPLRLAAGERIGDLLRHAERDLGGEADGLVFHHRSIVRGLWCPDCGARRDRVRMNDAYTDAEIRCDCGAPTPMEPSDLKDRLSRSEAAELAHARWDEIGVPETDVVSVTRGERRAHYIVNRPATSGGGARWEAP